MAKTDRQPEVNDASFLSAVCTDLEVAALNARNLLQLANRELLENFELGLTLVVAAERYVEDIVALNEKLCAAKSNAEITKPSGVAAPDGFSHP